MFFKRDTNISIKVGGMSCPHCERSVCQAAMAVKGVTDAKASAKKGMLIFKTADKSVVEKVKANIIEKGFTVE